MLVCCCVIGQTRGREEKKKDEVLVLFDALTLYSCFDQSSDVAYRKTIFVDCGTKSRRPLSLVLLQQPQRSPRAALTTRERP
jgi:hypothetical protein